MLTLIFNQTIPVFEMPEAEPRLSEENYYQWNTGNTSIPVIPMAPALNITEWTINRSSDDIPSYPQATEAIYTTAWERRANTCAGSIVSYPLGFSDLISSWNSSSSLGATAWTKGSSVTTWDKRSLNCTQGLSAWATQSSRTNNLWNISDRIVSTGWSTKSGCTRSE